MDMATAIVIDWARLSSGDNLFYLQKENTNAMRASMGKEIVIRVSNEIGVLDQMCRLLAETGINTLGVSGTVHANDAILRLVTTDNLRATDMLRQRHFNPQEMECILVERPHKPGMLRRITEDLVGEGINLEHLYATAPENQAGALMVLSTSNNERALVLLNR